MCRKGSQSDWGPTLYTLPPPLSNENWLRIYKKDKMMTKIKKMTIQQSFCLEQVYHRVCDQKWILGQWITSFWDWSFFILKHHLIWKNSSLWGYVSVHIQISMTDFKYLPFILQKIVHIRLLIAENHNCICYGISYLNYKTLRQIFSFSSIPVLRN